MMALTAIDAVLSDKRLNLDKTEVIKAMRLLKTSSEFARIANTATAIGLSHLGIDPKENVSLMLEFVENIMALSVDIGYNICNQEIGARELEAFFVSTDTQEEKLPQAKLEQPA
jgi:hypothetical protein